MATTSLGFSIFSTFDSKGTTAAAAGLQNVAKTAAATAKVAGAAMAVAGGAVALYAADAIKAGIASNELQQRAGTALEVVLGSAKDATEQMEELRAFGSESPISMNLWIQAQQQMLAFGVEAEKIVPLLGAIQNTALAGGGTEEEIRTIIEVMARLSSSAEVTKGDLNVLGTQGVAAAQLVGNAFGQTSGAITSQISAGTFAVEDFYDGFITGADEAFGGVAEGVRDTFMGVVDRLKGVRRRIGEILATPFVDPAGGGAFVEIGNALADTLNKVEKAIKPLVLEFSGELEPTVRKVADAIRSVGDDITTENLRELITDLGDLAPVASAASAALGVKFAADIASGIPVVGNFVNAISPLATGIAVLAATSPELRAALNDTYRAIVPLVPVATDLAIVVADVLTAALKIIGPAISLVANNLEFIVPAAVAAAGAMTIYGLTSAAAGVASTTMAFGLLRVRDAVIAVTTAMKANPFLLIVGTAVAAAVAIGKLASQYDSVAESATDAGKAVEFNLNQVLEGTATGTVEASDALHTLVSDFQSLNAQLDVLAAKSMDKSLTGRIEEFFADKDAMKADADAIEQAIDGIDQALASAAQSGTTSAEVMDILTQQYGLSADEISKLMPELDAYNGVIAGQAFEHQRLTDAVGGTVAALQQYADEMRAQSDPAFAAIKAQQDLAEATAHFNEVANDSSSTQAEVTEAALAASEAYLEWTEAAAAGAQTIQEGVDPALAAHILTLEGGAEILAALEEAYGTTETAIASTADTAVTAAQDFIQSQYDLEDATMTALATVTGGTEAAVDGITEDYADWVAAGVSSQDALKRAADEYGLTVSQVADIVGIETQGMSAYVEDWVFSAKGQIDDLMVQGYTYAQALAIVADRTDMSGAQIEGAFRDARDAGLEFSDDYPATVRVDGAYETIARIQAVQRWIDGIQKTVTISFNYEGFMPRGGAQIPRAGGGIIRGPGGGTSDRVPVAASNGEFMMQTSAVDKFGVGFMTAINEGRVPAFASGGRVSSAHTGAGSPTSVAATALTLVFNGPVASERAAESMVVKAIKSAQQAGRIPKII